MQSAILVANPIPARDAIARKEIEPVIENASREAKDKKIHGKDLTPFLLQRINVLTQGKSVLANLALLRNNATLAGQIAEAIRSLDRHRT